MTSPREKIFQENCFSSTPNFACTKWTNDSNAWYLASGYHANLDVMHPILQVLQPTCEIPPTASSLMFTLITSVANVLMFWWYMFSVVFIVVFITWEIFPTFSTIGAQGVQTSRGVVVKFCFSYEVFFTPNAFERSCARMNNTSVF